MVDHQHPLAEGLDVRHVVAGEEHGRSRAPVVLPDEVPDAALHGDVQPDRRLVQEQHPRPVQQGRRHLALHPLAQGEAAHRLLQQGPQVKQVDQLVKCRPELGHRDAVDGPVQLEGVRRRDVPHQLVAVAHHQGDLAQVGPLPAPGVVAQHLHLAPGGVEQAGEHLQGGGLARPVRAQEAHDLPRLHVEGDPVYGRDVPRAPAHQAAHGGQHPRLPLVHGVHLAQVAQAGSPAASRGGGCRRACLHGCPRVGPATAMGGSAAGAGAGARSDTSAGAVVVVISLSKGRRVRFLPEETLAQPGQRS